MQNQKHGPKFFPMQVTCKGQALGGVLDREYSLENTTGFGGPANCYQRGHCNTAKWIRNGAAPDADHPAGPVERIVALTHPQWGSFYHFMVESMPRMYWIHKHHPELLHDTSVHWHTGSVGKVAQAWAGMFGIAPGPDGSHRLLDGTWNVSREIFIPPVMIGTFCSKRWNMDPTGTAIKKEIMDWARGQLYRSMGFEGGASNAMVSNVATSILLVRRHPNGTGEGRRVLNHDAIVSATKKYLPGWTISEYSDYPSVPTAPETCRLFYGAALIMGPHGAGFSNLACARPGAVLVEFQALDHHDDFELYAQALGLGYVGIRTEIMHRGHGIVPINKVKAGLVAAKTLVADVVGRGLKIN